MQLLHYNCPIEQLGKRYTLIRLLGGGGMADVYLAWDERDHHEAAVKVIRPDALNPRMLQRFLNEGEVVASLDHPHIIHIYGDGVEEETFTNSTSECKVSYIPMEYVKGSDLKKRLVPGQAHPLDETVRIFGQLCLAVQYAHSRGVIHRDIKPANILFREHPLKGDQVVLSDFGLALLADDTHYSLPDAGTPAYMALEQWCGKPEPASDIFSLGVVLYELCTGCLPSRSPQKPTLLNPSLPPALDDVILRALSNEPSQRMANASLFWQVVQSMVKETPLSLLSPSLAVQLPVTLLSTTPSPEDVRQQDAAPSIPPVRPGNAVSPVEGQSIFSPLPNTSAEADIAEVKTARLPSTPEDAQPTEKLLLSATGPGWLPPCRPMNPPSTPPKRNRRAIIITTLVLIMLLVFGSLTYLITRISSATITITPASQTVQDTYLMQGVTSNANPDNHQVTVRPLSSTKTVTDTVTPTGHIKTVAAVSATGTLTFSSSYPDNYNLARGTKFNGPNGITIITDTFVTIPAGNFDNGIMGKVSVNAHITPSGSIGNMSAGTISQYCCVSGTKIHVTNDTFSGGVDAQGYNFLQESDITSVTNAHQATLKNEAQNDIRGQKESGEQLLGNINCADPKTTPDVPIGDQGPAKAVTSAHVTVSVSCNAEVYDALAVQTIVDNSLKQKASKDPGVGYILAGHIITQVQSPQTRPDGKIMFSVTARGVWYYQWTDANKQTLLNKVQGKSKLEAQEILNHYPGVGNAKIGISNGATTLPSDVSQITLDVKTVIGL